MAKSKKISRPVTRKCSKCGQKISDVEFSAQDTMCYTCWRSIGGRL